ncbi:hypothetical protein ACTI_53220 [Actinoplanes sp. OR16]|uniref:hypothetical protein n=1 Tax=Actinoplanes sp. OR16 TaxID=946334 RepID=UPI000F6C8E08|nr:hypothetical protein [Actinoplanes sp. OR16]BBH68637.1 hypothetical protein ACTI_53220 [Actinoplanes sp. OR16]
MSHNELKDLLEDASAAVQAPSLAHSSWAHARKIKRRRYAGTAVAAAVLPILAVLLPAVSPSPPPVVTPTPAVLAPEVQQLPSTMPERLVAPLPAVGADLVPSDFQPLSRHPIDAAMAVVQATPEETGDQPQPIYALAPDGLWVQIDVGDLTFTHDEGGNQAAPLRPLSLSPDRRRVALPQPQAVVVVDLTTAKAHRIAVPGLNEQVAWQDDTTVLVGAGGPGASAVDWAAGTIAPLPAALSLWDSVGFRDGTFIELPATRRELRTWHPDEATPVRSTGLTDPPGYAVNEWYGSPITDGARVVRGSWGSTPTQGYEAIAVVGADDGVVERVLDLGPGRWKGCCKPLTFLGADTVLVQTERDAVIAWNFRTGAVQVVTSGPFSGILSIRAP